MPVFASALCILACILLPDPQARPVRQAYSVNKEFRLQITPGRGVESGRPCRAELQHRPRGERPKRVWQVELINDTAPMQAFIHDTGRWVVTLDEYRKGGAEHALVVYDEKGDPAREWTLDEILKPEELQTVERQGEAIFWLHDAKQIGFDWMMPHFVIELGSDRFVRVDLERLELIDEPGRPIVQVAEQEEETEDPSPLDALLELLSAGEGLAEELLAAMADPNNGDPNGPLCCSGQTEAPATEVDALEDLNRAEAELMAEYDQLAEQEQAALDRDAPSGPDGLDDVPEPQPGDWVDYVAWANEHTQPGEAAELMREATTELHVQSEIEWELFDAAWEGDPDALNSPEVTSWINANQDALEVLREAENSGFNGYDLQTAPGEDARMIGVLLPHLSGARQLAKVRVMQGKQFAANGDLQSAANQYMETLRGGGVAGRGVTMIENLVGVAVENLATESLLDLYASDTNGDLDYQQMVEQFDSHKVEMRPMSQIINFERAMMLDEIQRLYAPDDIGGYTLAPGALQQFSDLTSMSNGTANAVMAGMALSAQGFENIRDSSNAYYDRLAGAMSSDYATASADFSAIESDHQDVSVTNPIVGMLAPSLSRAHTLSVRAEAQRNAVQTIARIRAFEQQHGALPTSLADIAAPGGADPFSGQAFVYERDDQGGFRLYSVGPDMIDNGGTPSDRWDDADTDIQYWPRP